MKPEEVKNWETQWNEVSFYDDIEILKMHQGRSAKNIICYSKKTNSKYTIFVTDFVDMAMAGDVIDNKIRGLFKVVKRGRSLGICLKNTKKQNKDCYCNFKFPIPRYI